MHTAAADIEVIELAVPAEVCDDHAVAPAAVHLQWAAQVFHAARVQPARTVVAAPVTTVDNGAGGARTFYWWMLALAVFALALT